jgi:hypothetical protein
MGKRGSVIFFEAQQKQIEQERQQRVIEHKQAIAASGLERSLAARQAGTPLNIFAEGDSWFDYPLYTDTIGWLQANGTPYPKILNLAHYGDAATEMLGVSRRKRIIDNLTDPDNGNFDALLFSAGGNDIAGDQFCLWILQNANGGDPQTAVDRQRLADIIGVIHAAYADLIEIRNSINPACTIFLHSYDFAQPNGIGVCGLGPWLKPSLDLRKWTQFPQAVLIVKLVLLAFDEMLVQIEQQYKNVIYVRTQSTLSPNTDWANELHPTEQGFNKIANVFLKAMRARFPGRI